MSRRLGRGVSGEDSMGSQKISVRSSSLAPGIVLLSNTLSLLFLPRKEEVWRFAGRRELWPAPRALLASFGTPACSAASRAPKRQHTISDDWQMPC